MALLSHVYLPCSLESDENLLETSHGLGTAGAGASLHRGREGRKQGPRGLCGEPSGTLGGS